MADTTKMDERRTSRQHPRRSFLARRRADDRGATLVEAAFVMPVFVLMIFGIFEFSGNIMARTGANAAVKAGARMASVQGAEPMADREILRRMALEGAGIRQDKILQIVIWRVNGTSASDRQTTPPSACTSATSPGRVYVTTAGSHPCNVYNLPQDPSNGAFKYAKLPLTTDSVPTATPLTSAYADYWFGCNSTNDAANVGHKLDCGWEPHPNPNGRRSIEKSPTHTGNCTGVECDPTDVVGISMTVQHKNYTGFFGSGTTIRSTTYTAIEPQGYDD